MIQMYRRFSLRPDKEYSVEVERAIAKSVSEYLAGVGAFTHWQEHVESGEIYTTDEVRIC
jgi:hypothetical protein